MLKMCIILGSFINGSRGLCALVIDFHPYFQVMLVMCV